MNDIIRLLPDSVANQIAAGEVIQRPAAVVKELVENAVDAGATEIKIIIKDAGRTLIQVVDNGKGMSPTDALMAFERHATSKITSASDLFALRTMGFRGEALPSISAIAHVELRTMTAADTLGTRIVISGSQKELQESCVCTRGSNFMVRDLFYNTPARRKFLKSDAVELSNIMREFERMALVNEHIHLSIETGTRTLDLRPGSFKERICSLWKNAGLSKQLIPIEVDTQVVKISGFISHPQYAKRRGALQYLIANGRNMYHPYFRKAILNCYEGIIARDTQPCFFLRFEVDPSTIDVNISPTKHEIKFEQETTIRPILEAAVRGALGKFAQAPSIDFNQDVMPLDPARDGEFVEAPSTDVDTSYNPFAQFSDYSPLPSSPAPRRTGSGHSDFPQRPKSNPVKNWESLYSGFMNDGASLSEVPEAPAEPPTLPGTPTPSTPGAICLQAADKYIITRSKQGISVIDQHRAHVKVLYARFMRELSNSSEALAMQKVAFPETLTLTPAQSLLLESVEDEVSRLGFLIAPTGEPGTWRIEGVPASLGNESAGELLRKVVESVADDGSGSTVSEPIAGDMLSRVALIMARAGAIRRGQRLTDAEMEQLLSDLYSLPDPVYTPGGNPIIIELLTSRLDALFS